MAKYQRSRKDIAKLEVEQQHHQSSSRKLSNITNLSLADEEFVYNVNCDIEHFLKQRHNNGVLLFPPVNNFRRFLIHQTCENFRQKYDLFTFSVGQGPFRRTVICFKNQLLDPHKYTETAAAANFETRNKHITTQVKSWRSDNRRIETSNFSNNITGTTINKRDRKMGVEKNVIDVKTNKSNSGDLYRPPALRNHASEGIIKTNGTTTTTTMLNSCATSTTNMSSTNTATTTTSTSVTTTSISCNSSPIHRNENVNNNNVMTTSTQQQQQQQLIDEQQQQTQQKQRQQQQARRERRPDRAVYIPRARRSQTTPPNTPTTIQIQQQQQQPPPPQQTLSAPVTTITGNTTTPTTNAITIPTENHTSKSLSQQLAITCDDTTSASVNKKPPSKADEVGKQLLLNNIVINTSAIANTNTNTDTTGNNSNVTTTTKKKDKLNKENKESREQRREQRLLKKLLSTTSNTSTITPNIPTTIINSSQSSQPIQNNHNNNSKNISKFCENYNLNITNTTTTTAITNNDDDIENEYYDNEVIVIEKTVIVNAQRETPPSPSSINNVVNYFSDEYYNNYDNDDENINVKYKNLNKSKGFNCDNSEEEEEEQKQQNLIKIQKLTTNSQLQQQQQQQQESCVIIENNYLDPLEQINVNIATSGNTGCGNSSSSILETSNNCIFYELPNPEPFVVNQIDIDINCVNNTTTTPTITPTTTNIFISNNNNNIMPKKSSNKSSSNKISSEMDNKTKLPNLRIEDVGGPQQPPSPAKCDIDEQELQRASKEINRSNRRIMKQTFISDVLQIPDHIDEEDNEANSKTGNISKSASIISALQRTTQFDSNTEEEEEEEGEDDWENLYNDSGDCLDPKIMQELTASVGKCKIELPKMDYSAYLTKQSILNEEEFPHVLEVSNFPVEFKNQDLLMVFSQYKESGFDIKWVDDTHALAVFSSSRIAAEVLTMGHPFVVLKPLAEATVESRMKAKKCAASLQPYRPRPQTCAALARRLVTGALGVRLKTAAAERENEKRVLHEAKERKLLAAKQRDEVWES